MLCFHSVRIWLRNLTYLIILLTAFLAEKAFPCSLPICDIPAELKTLEEKGQSYRFQYISKIKTNYSKEKDESTLNNLLDFSRAVVELVIKSKDEDYVLREAKGFRDNTLFLLLQWVWRDCEKMSQAFSELGSESQRYAAIDFFLRRTGEFRKEDEIRNLVCFANSAEKTSRKLNDAEYIPRHAVSLAAGLSTQLLEVINGWEGVFKFQSIDGPLAGEVDILKLVLFSTGGDLGIVAAISHPTLPPMLFQNVSFTGKPQNLSSRQSFASQVPSVIQLQFDKNFASVHGYVLEPIALKKTFFSAVRETKVDVFAKKPCSEADLTGQYEVVVSELKGIFSVELIGPNQLAGAFSSLGGELRLPFSYGRYNQNTGRLTFINLQANAPLGWRLLAEFDEERGCKVVGWGLSTFNTSRYALSMRKIH